MEGDGGAMSLVDCRIGSVGDSIILVDNCGASGNGGGIYMRNSTITEFKQGEITFFMQNNSALGTF